MMDLQGEHAITTVVADAAAKRPAYLVEPVRVISWTHRTPATGGAAAASRPARERV